MPAPINSEADVIVNRVNVALAKSQRLIASWLPPKTAEEIANEKTEEELEKEERELFAPVPELLGVGAPIPKDFDDGLPRRSKASTMDMLRKQLLGKDAFKAKLTNNTALSSKVGSKPFQTKPTLKEDTDDEDDGRAAMFKSRKTKKRTVANPEEPVPDTITSQHGENDAPEGDNPKDAESKEDEMVDKHKNVGSVSIPHTRKRPAASFLDELLAEKAKKKKKRKKNKGPGDVTAA